MLHYDLATLDSNLRAFNQLAAQPGSFIGGTKFIGETERAVARISDAIGPTHPLVEYLYERPPLPFTKPSDWSSFALYLSPEEGGGPKGQIFVRPDLVDYPIVYIQGLSHEGGHRLDPNVSLTLEAGRRSAAAGTGTRESSALWRTFFRMKNRSEAVAHDFSESVLSACDPQRLGIPANQRAYFDKERALAIADAGLHGAAHKCLELSTVLADRVQEIYFRISDARVQISRTQKEVFDNGYTALAAFWNVVKGEGSMGTAWQQSMRSTSSVFLTHLERVLALDVAQPFLFGDDRAVLLTAYSDMRAALQRHANNLALRQFRHEPPLQLSILRM